MPALLDPRLRVLSAVGLWPGQVLEHYLALSGLTRGAFQRARRELEAAGVLRDGPDGTVELRQGGAQAFLEGLYPGLSAALAPMPASVTVETARAVQDDVTGFESMMGLDVDADRSCQHPLARVVTVPVPPGGGATANPLVQASHVWGRAAVVAARKTG